MGFPQDWQYKIKATLASAVIDEALTDFTSVIVRAGATGIPDHVFAQANADGSDIRVTLNADGSGLLTTDVIHWVGTLGSEAAMLRVGPMSRSALVNDEVWIWYGNSSATAQTGSAAYDDDWRGYWPGQEVGDSGLVADRTANGFDMNGNLAADDLIAGPITGNALDFDGSQYAEDTEVGVIPATVTLSCWWKTAITVDGVALASTANGSTGPMFLSIDHSESDVAAFGYGTKKALETAPASFNDNAWHHVVGVNLSNTSRRLVVDGTEEGANTDAAAAVDRDNIILGAWRSSDAFMAWVGGLCEAQYHQTARSDAWIQAEYAQTSDPVTAVLFTASAALERVHHNDLTGSLDALASSANEAYGSYLDAGGVRRYRNELYGDSHNEAYGALGQNEACGSHFQEVP